MLKKNWLSILLIIAGLGLILKPSVANYYNEWQQEQLIQSLTQTMTMLAVESEIDNENESGNSQSQKTLAKTITDPLKNMALEGKIEIKAIDLDMPLLKGASPEHLKLTACAVKRNIKMGGKDNYVIAGHRGRSYGRHFNRLDELVKGDEICLTDIKGNQYVYLVKSNFIVDQTEMWVLETRSENELTLITCDPAGVKNPQKRRIIKAILK